METLDAIRYLGFAMIIIGGVGSMLRLFPQIKAMPVAATRAEFAAACQPFRMTWAEWLSLLGFVLISIDMIFMHVVPSWEWHDALLLGGQVCALAGMTFIVFTPRLNQKTRAIVIGVTMSVLIAMLLTWLAVRVQSA